MRSSREFSVECCFIGFVSPVSHDTNLMDFIKIFGLNSFISPQSKMDRQDKEFLSISADRNAIPKSRLWKQIWKSFIEWTRNCEISNAHPLKPDSAQRWNVSIFWILINSRWGISLKIAKQLTAISLWMTWNWWCKKRCCLSLIPTQNFCRKIINTNVQPNFKFTF